MKTLPGWLLSINEESNCVYKIILQDAYGRKVEITDTEIDNTIQRAISDAFEIEKQISENWNRFLFELCVQNLDYGDTISKEYNNQAFGSWYLETPYKRLVYDGENNWLLFQVKLEDNWKDVEIIQKEGLAYSDLVRQLIRFNEKLVHYLPEKQLNWWKRFLGFK